MFRSNMPIQPLSETTSRVLTSTQSLNNSASVIKELVDNALDAGASTISIEIAANTLDKIIVKDDGSGVGVDDRRLLCRRGCTSKIGNLDDLANLGGSFLGFRGTALASIAELCEETSIITRVDGEQLATSMTFGPSGELLHSASVPHNVGTTVRVESFLASIPVRRQVVLKDPSKVLDDIKKLLHGYALARPLVRTSLRVLKAKNEKANWSFASCKGEEPLAAAAVQIVGKNIANMCMLRKIRSEVTEEATGTYKIEAFLLRPGINFSQAGGVGQFISVDRRPVNHDKGIMKDLVKRYKMYLNNNSSSDKARISKPFLAIHFHCPSRSYDVNVEPAKDVVLFHDQSCVLDLAEKLFSECYGELDDQQIRERQNTTPRNKQLGVPFDVLLSRKINSPVVEKGGPLVEPSSSAGQGREVLATSDRTSGLASAPVGNSGRGVTQMISSDNSERQPLNIYSDRWTPSKAYHDMSEMFQEFDNETGLQYESDEVPVEEEEYDPNDITINNPFVRARLHATQRSPMSADKLNQPNRQTTERSPERDNLRTTSLAERSLVRQSALHRKIHLPTPTTSPLTTDLELYQNPGPPFPRRHKHGHEGDSGHDEHSDRSPQQVIDRYVTAGPNLHTERAIAPLGDELASHSSGSLQQVLVNKPFRSPLRTPRPKFPADASTDKPPGTHFHVTSSNSGGSTLPAQHIDDDLQHILDFERRKKTVNQKRRGSQTTKSPEELARIQQRFRMATGLTPLQLSSHNGLSVSRDAMAARFGGDTVTPSPQSQASNPHRNRYLAAVRSLKSSDRENTVSGLSGFSNHETTSLDNLSQRPRPDEVRPPGRLSTTDPRGYLISLGKQHSHPGPSQLLQPVKRGKTFRLPFETIPSEHAKHNLELVTAFSGASLFETCRSYVGYDPYLRTGRVEFVSWSPTSKCVDDWQETLQRLVGQRYRNAAAAEQEGNDGAEFVDGQGQLTVNMNLARAIKAHLDMD